MATHISQITLFPPFHISKIKRKTTIRINYQQPKDSSSLSSNGDEMSYLKMWKRSMDRKRKENELFKIGEVENPELLKKKSDEFKKVLEVPKEERDKIQQLQVIDRAAAAIAAARAFLDQNPPPSPSFDKAETETSLNSSPSITDPLFQEEGNDSGNSSGRKSSSGIVVPGPDFWSWTPPPEDDPSLSDVSNLQKATPKTSRITMTTTEVMEKARSAKFLEIPFESKLSENLLPFQSFSAKHEVAASNASAEEISSQFSTHAEEAAQALNNIEEHPSYDINHDGSRWWKETGVETRPDGVVYRWTLNRGVTADGVVECEDKYWEATDEFGYKELGSEKSGRDANGNVWHEYWKEAMWQDNGIVYMEKSADKWGKNGKGDEWQEKWWEGYDSYGKADKWAHKWCSIDPNTQIEAGHAHIWHERWGENYNGGGGSIKYSDKWAERWENDAWVKWGDKWDENFDVNSNGAKQGETWWEGKHGERWNRTWGEQHNGSGWVHKYGKSSSGEHWDTHLQEDTWYERYPHYGFMHCFENSVQLREVQRPNDKS